MSQLDNIIDLTINRETATVSQAGFGAANFLSNDARFDGRIKSYGSVTEVNEDTFVGADAKAFAAKYFGQPIKPQKLYISKKLNNVYETFTLTFSADFVAANTIDLNINAVAIAQTTFATDHATTLAAVATNIALNADVTSATVTGAREITVVAAAYGDALVVTGLVVASGASQATGTIAYTQYGDAVGTDVESLQAASLIDDDWFALAIYSRVEADILAVAAYMAAFKKIFIAVTNDADVITSATDDAGSVIKGLGYENSGLIYAGTAGEYSDAALFGKCLPKDPGSITWAFKSLVGITADKLSSSELTEAHGKNVNTYTTVAGQSITQYGTMASGEYIDIIRGAYWLHARIQEAVFLRLVTEDKIPYTNNGVNIVVTDIEQVLSLGVTRGVLKADPAPAVVTVDTRDVSTIDRGNRYYPDITFTGEFAGAIHKLKAVGTISV